MGLDIRWPIGLLFVTFGVLLAGFGLASDAGLYERSLGVNVNRVSDPAFVDALTHCPA